ncbi:MAG: hypothetical protein ACLRZG_07025 [Streptococcus sp.]
MNFVVRSTSGKQGYVGIVNGRVFGIGSMGTVDELKSNGAKHLKLDDGDFTRFLDSQSRDSAEVSRKRLKKPVRQSLKQLNNVDKLRKVKTETKIKMEVDNRD